MLRICPVFTSAWMRWRLRTLRPSAGRYLVLTVLFMHFDLKSNFMAVAVYSYIRFNEIGILVWQTASAGKTQRPSSTFLRHLKYCDTSEISFVWVGENLCSAKRWTCVNCTECCDESSSRFLRDVKQIYKPLAFNIHPEKLVSSCATLQLNASKTIIRAYIIAVQFILREDICAREEKFCNVNTVTQNSGTGMWSYYIFTLFVVGTDALYWYHNADLNNLNQPFPFENSIEAPYCESTWCM